MKYIIADPDEKSSMDLKRLLDNYVVLDFQGSFTTMKAAEDSIYKDCADIAFIRMGKAELNAFKLLDIIHELNPSTKVIFLGSNVEYAVEAFECGVNGFLFVPSTREKIEHLFGNWMNKGGHKQNGPRGLWHRG